MHSRKHIHYTHTKHKLLSNVPRRQGTSNCVAYIYIAVVVAKRGIHINSCTFYNKMINPLARVFSTFLFAFEQQTHTHSIHLPFNILPHHPRSTHDICFCERHAIHYIALLDIVRKVLYLCIY